MAKKKTVVYAFQCADLFHYGHLQALVQAKALGDYLIVGILTDGAIIRYKREPIIPYWQRIAIVEHQDYVDRVMRQDDVDPTHNLQLLKEQEDILVNILVHGDDWNEDFLGVDYIKSIGGRVMLTQYYPYQSTTKIIERIVKNARKFTKL